MRPIKTLDAQSFAKYGLVIERRDSSPIPPEGTSQFDLLASVESSGWRVGYITCRARTFRQMEYHHATQHTFEPTRGVAALVVAQKDEPENFEVFLLDRPVIIRQEVWHAVVAISDLAEIKFMGDLSSSAQNYTFDQPHRIAMVPA